MQWGRRRYGASVRVSRKPGHWKSSWGPWLRRFGVLLILAAGGFGLYAGAQHLLDPERFPLRHIYFQGQLRNLSTADLQPLVQSYLGQNFFALDITHLYATLITNPWIEQITIRRRWPDTLEIHFQERTAFGRWGEDEMVDVNGQRFRPTVIRQPGPWPYLAGPDSHERLLIQTYEKTARMLRAVGLQPVRLLQDERRAWQIILTNGTTLSLGREDFEQRLQRFIAVYPRLLAERIDQVAIVDLRYTHGFAVRWSVPADFDTRPVPQEERRAVTAAHGRSAG